MNVLRKATEGLARKTTRRGFFGRGAEVAFGALMGVAAGGSLAGGARLAGATNDETHCAFPIQPCPCEGCQSSGVCAKPCIIMTLYYASGCWVTTPPGKSAITCCDCDCDGQVPGFPTFQVCGCGSDYHNDLTYCPDGNASN